MTLSGLSAITSRRLFSVVWSTPKLQSLCIRIAGYSIAIVGMYLLLQVSLFWGELASEQGIKAANHHLLKSSPGLMGIILVAIGMVVAILGWGLGHVKSATGKAIAETLAEPSDYNLSAAVNEYPAEGLSPDHLKHVLSDQRDRLHQQKFQSPFLREPTAGESIDELEQKRILTLLCCTHEAGHALFFVLRRAKVRSITIFNDLHLNSSEPVRYGATTDWSGPERECVCGGYVRSLTGKERQAHGSDAYNIQLGSNCDLCLQYIVELVATLYAGYAATELLMPMGHDPSNRIVDDEIVNRLFQGLPGLRNKRAQIISRAEALARAVVRREAEAIKALGLTLAYTDEPLEGKMIEEIIRKNLIQDTLPG